MILHPHEFMTSTPSINVARLTYLLVCEAAGVAITLSTKGTFFEVPVSVGIIGGLVVAGFFILLESLMKGFTLRGFSTATFGLGVGLLCAWLLTRVEFSNLLELGFRDSLEKREDTGVLVNALRLAIDVTLFASLGFIGAALALRGSRDDFAFIIPYVRFRQDASSGQPVLLDTEAIIDGRVHAILKAGFLHGRIIVPKHVFEELQRLAESENQSERQRGQRGLEALDRLQNDPQAQVTLDDSSPQGAESPHSRLIETSRLLGARLMTLDESLTKVAKLQGVEVLNLNELDDALKPAIVVGQRLRIPLVRGGKEDHQAVGYLPDGSMIVVNHGAPKIGGSADVVVVSTLQTSGGQMVFGEIYNGGTIR